MAKIPLQKIRITGMRGHYKILMQELHRWGILEIIQTPEFIERSKEQAEEYFGVFDLARINFTLRFLAPYETAKAKMDSLLSGGKLIISEEDAKLRLKNFSPKSEDVLSECEQIEEETVRDKNQLEKIRHKKALLAPFRLFHTPLQKAFHTPKTQTWLGSVRASKKEVFVEAVATESNLVDLEILNEDEGKIYIRLTAAEEIAPRTAELLQSYGFDELDITNEFLEFYDQKPREILRSLEREEAEIQAKLEKTEKRKYELAAYLDDLRILADYNTWRKKKNDLQYKILKTKNIFAFEAWMPLRDSDRLEKWIRDIFVGEVALEKIESEENEEPPVLVENKKGADSYQPITEMFGTPGNKDIDPTPYLMPFFFIFFGLCLSDVGYGLILSLIAAFFLFFGQFTPSAKVGLKLLLFCGIGAFLGGIIVGGYFGMTPEQAPSFLLSADYKSGIEEAMPFKGQLLDPMKGSGPILFLIVAMSLGVIQLLTGVLLDFVRRLKIGDYVGAFCDPLAWFFFLLMLVGFALADQVGLPKETFKNLSIAGAIVLVMTQGRHQKNWFLKPISGVLGLYNITGYVSDILSYSRIMALGLATGVIGFAMNLTAGILGGMMPHPILGFIVAVAFLLFGHSLNFALSLLGAFVHSGRLQFIEFFGKFFEGGGRKFRPFVREKKYLFFRNS